MFTIFLIAPLSWFQLAYCWCPLCCSEAAIYSSFYILQETNIGLNSNWTESECKTKWSKLVIVAVLVRFILRLWGQMFHQSKFHSSNNKICLFYKVEKSLILIFRFDLASNYSIVPHMNWCYYLGYNNSRNLCQSVAHLSHKLFMSLASNLSSMTQGSAVTYFVRCGHV